MSPSETKWNWKQMAVEGECRLRATKWEAQADETSLISCNSNKEQYLIAEFFRTELFGVPAFIDNQCTELLPWALYIFIMHQVVFFCTHLPCLYFKYCNQKRVRFPRAKLSEVYEVSYASRQSKQYSEKHLPWQFLIMIKSFLGMSGFNFFVCLTTFCLHH